MTSTYREIYKDWKNIGNYFWGDPMDFRFLVVSKLHSCNSKNTLDIGCSTGVSLSSIASEFKVGIDIDIKSLRLGKKKYPSIEFIQASGNNLPFKNSSFHQIISIHTLDTSAIDEKIVIDEIYRICKKNGRIFLTGNWYNNKYEYVVNSATKERICGSWITDLKNKFEIQVRWYTRPRIVGFNAKIKKFFLTKIPDFLFEIIRPDKWLYREYKENNYPLNEEPYIVTGSKLN